MDRRLRAGLPLSSFRKLQTLLDVSPKEISQLTRISPRTLARRKREGRFNLDESERILRLQIVRDRALDLHEGNLVSARLWLKKPRATFGGKSGLEFAETSVGAQEVQDLIGRIEHGVCW